MGIKSNHNIILRKKATNKIVTDKKMDDKIKKIDVESILKEIENLDSESLLKQGRIFQKKMPNHDGGWNLFLEQVTTIEQRNNIKKFFSYLRKHGENDRLYIGQATNRAGYTYKHYMEIKTIFQRVEKDGSFFFFRCPPDKTEDKFRKSWKGGGSFSFIGSYAELQLNFETDNDTGALFLGMMANLIEKGLFD